MVSSNYVPSVILYFLHEQLILKSIRIFTSNRNGVSKLCPISNILFTTADINLEVDINLHKEI